MPKTIARKSPPKTKPANIDVEIDIKQSRTVSRLLGHVRTTQPSHEDPYSFLEFALPLARRSHSQLFQDLWALWESAGKESCYFVEFGGADGKHNSNTYLLETEMGWSGLVAEPNQNFATALKANRKCAVSNKCVYSRSGETIAFLPCDNGELSRIASIVPDDRQEREGRRTADPVDVETISLHDLLTQSKAPKTIDFMSVDTEGSEFEILSNFNFSKWDIRTLCIEHSNTSARQNIFELMTSSGYARKWSHLSKFDDWYVKRD